MNTYGMRRTYFHVFLTWALREGECSASRPDRFSLSDTYPPVSRVGSTARLNVTAHCGEAKVLLHISGIKPRFLSYPTRSPPELRLMQTLVLF
jgi:hypothetical protein